jgi:hypothetical protein
MGDFKENIQIDKYSLDLEFEKHPMLYHEFAMDMVDAEKERDDMKDQLELLHAKLTTQIRDDPKKFNLEKVTEGAITSVILQDINYQKLQKDYSNSVYNAKVLKISIESLNKKQSSMEHLVKLYLGEYYSKEAPREIKENAAERVADFIHNDLNKPSSRLRRNAS